MIVGLKEMLKKENLNTWEGLSALVQLALRERDTTLKELFHDEKRHVNFAIETDALLFDYSKNRMSEQAKSSLLKMAQDCGLQEAIELLFNGAPINETEGRGVRHTALRSSKAQDSDDYDIHNKVSHELKSMQVFTEAVLSGEIRGFTGKKIENVVNIGIGGSDLGPRMVTNALAHYHTRLKVDYVSNVDGSAMHFALKELNPETTLFIVVSKTFTTQETMANAKLAKEWLAGSLGSDAVAHHFVGVSGDKSAVEAFGIKNDRIFQVWDWVGGRFSLWSAVGLSLCMAVGYDNFEALLRGGEKMDLHFREQEFDSNIPVMMGLVGIWNRNFLQYETQAIIPYTDLLRNFPAYLQQAEMESNGKSINRSGKKVDSPTCPIIWGSSGTDAQHAYFQLLHQGTTIVPCDFICACRLGNGNRTNHEMLLANFLAQPEALMSGKTETVAYAELLDKGMDAEAAARLAPYCTFDGDRPSTSILFKQLDPESVGQLVAMYEHKIFVQGYLWGIFSFDQWGVELGKQLATPIYEEICQKTLSQTHDPSTEQLLRYFLDKG
jgi:glucose-6-phosphate isomerase